MVSIPRDRILNLTVLLLCLTTLLISIKSINTGGDSDSARSFTKSSPNNPAPASSRELSPMPKTPPSFFIALAVQCTVGTLLLCSVLMIFVGKNVTAKDIRLAGFASGTIAIVNSFNIVIRSPATALVSWTTIFEFALASEIVVFLATKCPQRIVEVLMTVANIVMCTFVLSPTITHWKSFVCIFVLSLLFVVILWLSRDDRDAVVATAFGGATSAVICMLFLQRRVLLIESFVAMMGIAVVLGFCGMIVQLEMHTRHWRPKFAQRQDGRESENEDSSNGEYESLCQRWRRFVSRTSRRYGDEYV